MQGKTLVLGALKGPSARWRSRRRLFLIVGVPLVLLASFYAADLMITSGKVPRGVTAAGVSLGGLTPEAAEQRLREVVGPRADHPIPVTVATTEAEVDPNSIGLTIDSRATVDQAGAQPLNPITRLMSFVVETPIGLVSSVDEQALTATLEELGSTVAEDPVEGSVAFVDGRPVSTDPQTGRRLDVAAATGVFTRDWASGQAVALPIVELAPSITSADVDTVVRDIAQPAVSGPITVVGGKVNGNGNGNGEGGVISEDTIAAALTFRAEDGRLVPEINENLIVDELRPQLAASETPLRNADIDFAATPPAKVPEQAGRRVDYDATLDDLLAVLTSTDDREITAKYVDERPTFTFDQINQLGPIEVIGEFQTSGFSGDSGKNIRRAAQQLDGIVIRPGETFSLNAATNPRNAASGYVEAGIIEHGRPARGVGGGVSQIATTLFNAGYFAGMEDIEHHEHSYYISRYPAGREATVFDDVLDVKFRNDGPTSVQIQTEWTSSSITVRLVGIKRYEVTSSQSGRSRPTSPQTVRIPAGEACSSSGGGPGFTITDTRTLRDIATGQTRTNSHTVVYDPIPKVVCGG
ncbi:VanW family protein [Mycolicibacterium lutetiense]|jgi:vancomycin resistance protein YoaR|uniref:Vancomycin resistance protein YoaR n=1 Tax=Mycolicibacterium lutetiense TaxID=1641992 RepID=A0ABS4ZS32_9MYCO|nr:VanW family protein [Mycolicibacterium lutetiense]MBP2452316.1 vancomycin resistance protein YoaR [Mycolicibacterium lutetiense]